MASLSGLRNRLQKAREEREHSHRDDTLSNTTDRLTDLTDWQNKIQEQGNKPQDWLDMIIFVKKNMSFGDEETRQRHLCCLYDRGLKTMEADQCKHDEAYAKFLISYAQFKSMTCKEDARELYNHARILVKSYASVHIAAAQFELSEGNKGKCRKILEKAKQVQAKPSDLLNAAFRNFVNDKQSLLPIQEKDDFKENIYKSESKRCSVDSDSGQSSEDSSTEIELTGKLVKAVRHPLRPVVPITPKHPHPVGEISLSTQCLEDTISFRMPSVKNLSRNRHVSRESEEADTVPIAYDSHRGTYSVGENECKPPLRSYHSTPDCKTKGPTSAGSSIKRKFVGKPLRVARTSLPKLTEGQASYHDEDTLDLKPLQDSTNDDGVLDYMTTSMRSTTISPPAEDSGIALSEGTKATHGLTSIPECSSHQTPKAKRPYLSVDNIAPSQKTLTSYAPVLSFSKSVPVLSTPMSTQKTQLSTLGDDVRSSSNKEKVDQKCWPKSVQSSVKPDGIIDRPVPDSNRNSPVIKEQIQQRSEVSSRPKPEQSQESQSTSTVSTAVKQIPGDTITVKGRSYFVLNIIGRGGSSKVFKVFDFEKKIELAIKQVNLEGVGEATLSGYLNEITLLKRLQYSNRVIKLYDCEYIATRAVLYVIMEVGDTDLAALFRSHVKQDQLTPIMIQFYWMEMLKAVGVLHKEGIIHSDLKPANFILVAGKLKLIDFGIANAIQEDNTSVIRDTQVGTLNFMSPESILGHNIDSTDRHRPQFKIGVKSDVWSLGCILYNMVYGRTPFQHITNQIAKLQAITSPHFKINFPDLESKQLLQILQSCLERDPKQRPTIDELLERPW